MKVAEPAPAFLAQSRVSMDTLCPSLIQDSFCPGWGWTCDLQRDFLLSIKFISFFIKSLPGRLTALIYGCGLCQTGRSDGAVNVSVVMRLAAFGVPSPIPLPPPLLPHHPSSLSAASSQFAWGWLVPYRPPKLTLHSTDGETEAQGVQEPIQNQSRSRTQDVPRAIPVLLWV